MLLYAITDRHLLPGSESDRIAALVPLARLWAARNIDYIQIREKDLSADDLLNLTRAIVSAIRGINQTTKVLVNGPPSIALEAGADGVHLSANAPPNAAPEARVLFAQSGRNAILSRSCHSVQEVLKIREESQRDPHATTSNTLILYAPVFEKILAPPAPNQPLEKIPGQGLDALSAAVHAAGNFLVLALGGITSENALACIAAGASGIAGIRLFLDVGWRNDFFGRSDQK
jgi:thiamine-phosphate pyrophosphorylase